MRPLDAKRWSRLSPLLDELLELDAAARQTRLAQLRAADAALADELGALLAKGDAALREGFLEGTALGSTHAAVAAGRVVGAYTLERALGAGGMGSVWLARRSDGRFDATVAVKLPHPGVLAQGGAERFAREARLLARLAHPNIAALLDAGVTADTGAGAQPYLVLEHVEGEPIDAWCDARSSSIEARLRLFLDVLAAVAHAHNKLVLHRDLKPGNILVTPAGQVKLLDFGIAKLLAPEAPGDAPQATLPAFTPDHAAPEQVQGGELSTATDVYALGVLLYELLSGQHPTASPMQSQLERLRAVVETDAPRLSDTAAHALPASAAQRSLTPARAARRLRGDLDNIVAKALKKAPAERYPGAAAMADDLRRHLDGEPVSAGPDTIGYRAAKFISRHRLSVGAASATLLALLFGVIGTTWQAIEARRERDDARWQAERALARGNLFNLMLGAMGGLDQPLTQRQILERAVLLVDKTFGKEPRIAVELLMPIAGQYYTLGESKNDLAVMRHAAELAAASGDPGLVAMVACNTVNTHIELGKLEDAQADLGVAAQALKRSVRTPPNVESGCRRAEAEVARAQGDYARALDRVSLLVAGRERSGDTRGNIYPYLLSLKISLLAETGDLAAAFAVGEQLLRLQEAAGRADSLDYLVAQRGQALRLMDWGEYAAARASIEAIVARWRGVGGSDPLPQHFELTRGQLLLRFADLPGAQRALAAAGERARDSGDVRFVAASDLALAQVSIALGRLDDAQRLLDAADAAPPRASARLGRRTLAAARAALLQAQGATAQAARLLDEELVRLDPAMPQHAVARAETLRTAARIALAAGDAVRAEAHAQAAVAAAQRVARDPGKSADVGEALLLLARAQQALGRPADAAATAARAVPSLAQGLSEDHPLTREARALAGR